MPVLLKLPTLEAIAAGEVDLVFRRWKRPTVRAGGTLKTKVGVLDIVAVDTIEADAITTRAARRAGYTDRDEALAALDGREGALYRIRVRYAGEDPRIALRNDARLSTADLDAIRARLDRLDRASSHGPWTRTILGLIRDHPGVRAPDLAAGLGRETQPFKTDVRKLKALGLTESLKVGYRLSPRGEAFLAKEG